MTENGLFRREDLQAVYQELARGDSRATIVVVMLRSGVVSVPYIAVLIPRS